MKVMTDTTPPRDSLVKRRSHVEQSNAIIYQLLLCKSCEFAIAGRAWTHGVLVSNKIFPRPLISDWTKQRNVMVRTGITFDQAKTCCSEKEMLPLVSHLTKLRHYSGKAMLHPLM